MPIPAVTNPTGDLDTGHIVNETDWNGAIGTLYTYLNGTVKPAVDALQASPANPLTSKGGLIGHDGVVSAQYLAGVNAQVLTRNSLATYGWEWADPAGAASGFTAGMIMLWFGNINSPPSGWVLCDGTLGTPNMQGAFALGAGKVGGTPATNGFGLLNTADVGGNNTHTHGVGTYVTAATSLVTAAGTSGSNAARFDHGHSITGSSAAPNNVGGITNPKAPTYVALAYIMKT
jgi:hypothetical protein